MEKIFTVLHNYALIRVILIKELKLSPLEESILKIANKLTKDRPLDLQELYKKSINELKDSKNDISQAIYQLILRNYIIEGSKITKEIVLENNNRNKIYKYIFKKPGCHLRELRKELNLSPRLIAWHLKMLEKFDFIRKNKITNKMAFFDSKINLEFDKAIFTLKDPKNLKILVLILLEPGINLSDLVDNSGLKLENVRNIIKILLELNLINKKEEYGQTNFFGNLEKITPIQEILKIPELEIKPPIIRKVTPPPLATEQIKILREFDHIGGNIRFKVAVRNETPTTISKLSVMLTPTTQYRIENRIQEIDVLTPGESRGVDFTLIPLTCGKSNVFGTLSYVDTYGKPHSLTIEPKEIWIKCPLVTPQKATKLDIENWKKSLLRGAAKVYFSNIPGSQAFKIASDQISALDLAEIEIDFDKMNAIFSGTAKVTGNTMIVELNIVDSNINLEVWTSDMKQATGFIAYIKNLITVALEVTTKIVTTMDAITNKIYNAIELASRISELNNLCTNKSDINDIILVLKELNIKSNSYFPDQKVTTILTTMFNKWINELKNIKDEKIWDRTYLNLQYDILNWIEAIIILSDTTSETYFKSPNVDETTKKNIERGNADLKKQLNEMNIQYSNQILFALMVINKANGLSMYNHNFTEESLDSDLIGGFLTAIQSFGMELSKTAKETAMKNLSYEHFEILLKDGQYTVAALITSGIPNQLTVERQEKLLKRFEKEYENDLKNFVGDVGRFRTAKDLVAEIFTKEM